jgi:hypothetical protein
MRRTTFAFYTWRPSVGYTATQNISVSLTLKPSGVTFQRGSPQRVDQVGQFKHFKWIQMTARHLATILAAARAGATRSPGRWARMLAEIRVYADVPTATADVT